MTRPHFQAFVDESGSDSQRDPGTYILAATVLADDDVDDVRAAMRNLLLKGQRKVHWHAEGGDRRSHIITVISGLPVEHVVAVHQGHLNESAERQRRICMRRLLYELDGLGTATAIFESRGRPDDRRDYAVFERFRSSGAVRPGLRVDHVPGPSEPILWIPDAVCGAFVADRTGESTYWRRLPGRHPVHDCS